LARKKITERGEKRDRGRPTLAKPMMAVGNADTYALWFRQYWPTIGAPLLVAKSGEEIAEIIRREAPDISASLTPLFPLMFKVIGDRRFPKIRTEAQIQFLADSLGAQGIVTPRRSREICAKERMRVEHIIVRREYYIECSCGYQGPALDGACRKCGTATLSQELQMSEGDV
jgi:hypothetical protein